jgi:iron(III) transport system permease protein
MNDRVAAAQLASVLLVVVALLLLAERGAAARCALPPAERGAAQRRRPPLVLRGAAAAALAAVRAAGAAGFRAAGGWLAQMLWQEAHKGEPGPAAGAFCRLGLVQLPLAARRRVLATLLALALAFVLRRGARFSCCARRRVLSLGYAVPGAVIAVGILLPVGWLQQRWPRLGVAALATGTVLG